jgi:hypothetical protein
MTETYREFLDRVHRQDIAKGQGIHKQGDCALCDEREKVGLSDEAGDRVRGEVPAEPEPE